MIPSSVTVRYSLDCCGYLCPVPILMTEEKIADLRAGEVLEVIFTDLGAKADLEAWCRGTGNEWAGCRDGKGKSFGYVRKKR